MPASLYIKGMRSGDVVELTSTWSESSAPIPGDPKMKLFCLFTVLVLAATCGATLAQDLHKRYGNGYGDTTFFDTTASSYSSHTTTSDGDSESSESSYESDDNSGTYSSDDESSDTTTSIDDDVDSSNFESSDTTTSIDDTLDSSESFDDNEGNYTIKCHRNEIQCLRNENVLEATDSFQRDGIVLKKDNFTENTCYTWVIQAGNLSWERLHGWVW